MATGINGDMAEFQLGTVSLYLLKLPKEALRRREKESIMCGREPPHIGGLAVSDNLRVMRGEPPSHENNYILSKKISLSSPLVLVSIGCIAT